jgi:dihydroflavonol-4-reductase
VSGMAAIISELTGIAAPRFSCPLWLARLLAPMMGVWARTQGEPPIYTRDSLAALSTNKVMSHSRAAEKLAYKPRPLHQSLKDTLAFYADQNQKQVIGDGD